MRSLVLAAALATAVAVPLSAQTATHPDHDAVVAAALDYMEGALTGNAERMERGTHPELTKVVIATIPQTGRQLLSYNSHSLLVEWVRGIGDGMANVDQNVDVTVFDIGNDMAVARAIGQIWYDFLQLAKIDGEWSIVNVLWAQNRADVPPATDEDRAGVEQAALDYIEGAYSGDAERMERAVHPELTKVMVAQNRQTGRQFLRPMGATILVEGTRAGMGTRPPDQWNIELEIYDVSHDIAAVKVTSALYIDHLQIGKVNGEWRLINVLWVPNPAASG
jgi:hypothetical protein